MDVLAEIANKTFKQQASNSKPDTVSSADPPTNIAFKPSTSENKVCKICVHNVMWAQGFQTI